MKKTAKASSRKKPVKKERVAKTRNCGTLTESGFWSFIRSSLRNKSRWWKPIMKVREKAKVAYKGPNKRRKYSYICSTCKKEWDAKSVNVHHLRAVGTLTCAADLPSFVENLFCEEDGLTLLCNMCHDNIHGK